MCIRDSTSSVQVQNVLLTISEVRNSALTVAMPDISESLRLLRQFNALRDAGAGMSDPVAVPADGGFEPASAAPVSELPESEPPEPQQ